MMLSVEEQNKVQMAALAGQTPAERGLPDTPEVQAAYDEAVTWAESLPDDAQVDMVKEWPDADLDVEGLYGESAADLAARIFGGGDDTPPEPEPTPDEPPAPEGKAQGGIDKNRGGAETLRRYWVSGEGAAKIAWGTPGDFDRCVALVSEYMPGRAKGYCNLRHHDATGQWPGEHAAGKSAKAWDESLYSRIEEGQPGGGRFKPKGSSDDDADNQRTDVGEQGVVDRLEMSEDDRKAIKDLIDELTEGGDRSDLTQDQRRAIKVMVDYLVEPTDNDSDAAPSRPFRDMEDSDRDTIRDMVDRMTGGGHYEDLPDGAKRAIRRMRAALEADPEPRENRSKGFPFVDARGLVEFKTDAPLNAGMPDGVMVALYAPDEVAGKYAVDDGTPPTDMHVTLAYLGKADDVGDPGALQSAVAEFAAAHPPLDGTVSGVGRFAGDDEGDPVYLSVDAPELAKMRADLVDVIEQAGYEVRKDHGFTPHITLGYFPPDAASPIDRIEPTSTQFGLLSVAYGPDVWDYPMGDSA